MKAVCFLTLLFLHLLSNGQDLLFKPVATKVDSILFNSDTVKILKGEKVCLTSSKEYGKLVIKQVLHDSTTSITDGINAISVATAEQTEKKFICIDFNSVANLNGTKTTALIINNPFNAVLHYRAKIYFANAMHYEEVSVGYLLEGIAAVETWQAELTEIILYDFYLEQ